jgi:hypothetical protein
MAGTTQWENGRRIKFDESKGYYTSAPDPKAAEKKARKKAARRTAVESARAEERVVGMVAAGVPVKAAVVAAGYAESSAGEVMARPSVKESLTETRERLSQVEGFRFEDSARFYKNKSEDGNVEAKDQITSRSRLDKLMGYESAAKVEISERRDLSVVVNLLSGVSVNPADLLGKLKAGRAREVECIPADGNAG